LTDKRLRKYTYSFLTSESELRAFLTAWETCTLPEDQWNHAAHVAAAAAYAWEHSPDAALPLLRARISAFNVASGGQNTADAGYHETLTRFWTLVVGSFVAIHRAGPRIDAVRAAVEHFGTARDLPRTYYTHDIVRDQVARRQWVPPQKLNEFTSLCANAGNAISPELSGGPGEFR
jgi:hypothetical protein